jgi:metallo-beta-lactamase family protein
LEGGVEITFLGAAGTVTGSRTLVETAGRKLLVDCGLFQGLKRLRLMNRDPFPVRPTSLDAIVLTHAHLDHTGYLPVLVRDGFAGPVYCTEVTAELTAILLRDSAHLQEEEAEFANRHGYSRHSPALPLYDARDAERAITRLRAVPMDQDVDAGQGVSFRMVSAGHLPGATSVSVTSPDGVLVFSGDVGRASDPLLPAPVTPPHADWLVLESTYGDRAHADVDPEDELAAVVCRTAERGGAVLMPAFAVGRAQLLMYHLHRLKGAGRIPELPVFVDSPMAARAIEVLRRHPSANRLTAAESAAALDSARVVASVQESKAVDRMTYPRVVISASGMASGGRVLHHLKAMAPDDRNTILFAGFQAPGTRGAQMVAGARDVKIHGAYVPIRADVEVLDGLSGHADCEELLGWVAAFPQPPRRVFLNHGETAAAEALGVRLRDRFAVPFSVPEHGGRFVLD